MFRTVWYKATNVGIEVIHLSDGRQDELVNYYLTTSNNSHEKKSVFWMDRAQVRAVMQ